jgi:sn-glycerol 3-phosphate transport system permease protein
MIVERRPWLTFFRHLSLIAGALLVLFPIWVAFVASTHEGRALMSGITPLWPGSHFWTNYETVLSTGVSAAGGIPAGVMLFNSTIMACSIALGKIIISILSAYAIVYFRFPLRMVFFWIIFMTLMLPVEVRILPTFEVVAHLGMLNSYAGLSIPLIASATATFLFRQFFLTVPDELVEAARVDGAGPLRFFWDILLPLSQTNIAALFVIMFIYGWNQYLWPLLITTDESFYTIVMGIQRMVNVADEQPHWHLVMATTMLALLPPVLVVLIMQRLFIKGLVDTEK